MTDQAEQEPMLTYEQVKKVAADGNVLTYVISRRELAIALIASQDALAEIEWIWHWTEEGEGYSECPWCRSLLEEGHKFDCTRQAALLPQEIHEHADRWEVCWCH